MKIKLYLKRNHKQNSIEYTGNLPDSDRTHKNNMIKSYNFFPTTLLFGDMVP